MSNLIEDAETELRVIKDVITHHTGQRLVDRLREYEDALKYIAVMPEPAPRQIAQRVLDRHSEE